MCCGGLFADGVCEGGAGAHGGGGFGVAGVEVAADVGGAALHAEEFVDDGVFVFSEDFGDGAELGGEVGVVALGGEGFGPVAGGPVVAAAVIVAGHAASGGLVVEEVAGGGVVEGLTKDFGLGVVRGFAEMNEADGEGEEFTEAVPAEIVLGEELLHVLGSAAAGSGFEKAAAVHERDDGKHLGGGAELEDGEKISEVVAQDVAGDADGVLAVFEALEGEVGGLDRGEDFDLESGSVVVGEVGVYLLDDFGVVGAVFVEPEDSRASGGAGAADGEFDPVLNGGVFRLASAPDVAFFHSVGEKFFFAGDDADDTVSGRFEGFVVGAVFFRLLSHEADVGNSPHGGGIEGTVVATEVDGGLIDAGIRGVGNDGEAVLALAVFVPHLTGVANHGRHGGVDDDVGGDVQVGDAFVGINHGEVGAIGDDFFEVFLELNRGSVVELGGEVAKPVFEVDTELVNEVAVLGEEVAEEDAHGMAEDDGVGDFHHGGLHVK